MPQIRGSKKLLDVLPLRPALLALDFDGVMTDNAVFVAEDGREWVRCSRGDGMGITLLRRAGLPIIVLSTETNPVVQARCRKLKIECLNGLEAKEAVFEQVLRKRRIPAADTVFVGNDVNDVGCLKLAGCGLVVADAHPEAVKAADAVLTHRGGHGAVREVCDLLLERLHQRARRAG
jgi:N-acylneuraminate cytidylyltransferase